MIITCVSQMLDFVSCLWENWTTALEIVCTGWGSASAVQSGRKYRPSQANNMQCYSNHIHSTKLIGKLWLQTGDLVDCSLETLLNQHLGIKHALHMM